MASKETQDLIIEALDYYIDSLKPDGECPDMESMRKIVKLDDIRLNLKGKFDDE